ncbi:hypothetical protein MRB53_023719 [Persea americana]|uniref:Uncharacterized protein n=1 Tax=Persea americana TaxID=3435 RepID=A0ACC2LB07_PERAE|nr:hypothetical protein MRB53_023719 [Persea americana]
MSSLFFDDNEVQPTMVAMGSSRRSSFSGQAPAKMAKGGRGFNAQKKQTDLLQPSKPMSQIQSRSAKIPVQIFSNPLRDVVNSLNMDGSTAMDVAKGIRGRYGRFKIRRILKKVGTKNGKEISRTSRSTPKRKSSQSQLEGSNDSQDNIHNALMVVAILIATVTYRGVLNPPCGVWQDDKESNSTNEASHYAGEAIMFYNFPVQYIFYIITNTIAFLVSIILILVLSFYTSCPAEVLPTVIGIVVPLIVFGCMLVIALLFFVFLFHSANSLLRVLGIKRLFDWMSSLLSRSPASEDQSASLLGG